MKKGRVGRVTVRRMAHARPHPETGTTPCCGLTLGQLARSRPHDRYAQPGTDFPEVTCDGSWLLTRSARRGIDWSSTHRFTESASDPRLCRCGREVSATLHEHA